MKKLLLLLLLLPSVSFADRLGSLRSDAQVLLSTQAIASSTSTVGVYPATSTASFPYSLTASSITWTSKLIGQHVYDNIEAEAIDLRNRFLINSAGNTVFTFDGTPTFDRPTSFTNVIDNTGTNAGLNGNWGIFSGSVTVASTMTVASIIIATNTYFNQALVINGDIFIPDGATSGIRTWSLDGKNGSGSSDALTIKTGPAANSFVSATPNAGTFSITGGTGAYHEFTQTINNGGNGGGINLTAGNAGDGKGGTSRTLGGSGGNIIIISGNAGISLSSGASVSTNFAGGSGGSLIFTSGTGGSTDIPGIRAGAGGNFQFSAGVGGTITNNAGPGLTGGTGGSFTFTGGGGGANSATGDGPDIGGNGGPLTFNGGTGGQAFNATIKTSGGGGNLTLNGGAAGTTGSGSTSGNPGALILRGGNSTGSGTLVPGATIYMIGGDGLSRGNILLGVDSTLATGGMVAIISTSPKTALTVGGGITATSSVTANSFWLDNGTQLTSVSSVTLANGRAVAQTAAVSTVTMCSIGGSDLSLEVSANVLISTSSLEGFTVDLTYTDENGNSQNVPLTFYVNPNSFTSSIGFTFGAVPYQGLPFHIRVKANTNVVVATVGTFTGCTYNVEGIIRKLGEN